MHRKHLNQCIIPIQARARIVLAKSRVRRIREHRFTDKTVKIQSSWRGSQGRKRADGLKREKLRANRMIHATVAIQSGFRMAIAVRVAKRKLARRYADQQRLIARVFKTYLAMKRLRQLVIGEHPIQCTFKLMGDEPTMPWKFKLQMAPVDEFGTIKMGKAFQTVELFGNNEVWGGYFERQVVKMQKLAR